MCLFSGAVRYRCHSCDLDKAVFPTFEEAIGIWTGRCQGWPPGLQDKNIRLLRHCLVKLMTTVIEENPVSHNNYHRRLVANLKEWQDSRYGICQHQL